MKVLNLPINSASQAAVCVRALRSLGVDAKCLVAGNSDYQDSADVIPMPRVDKVVRSSIYSNAKYAYQRWFKRKYVFNLIRWADVVHWNSISALENAKDLSYAKKLGKVQVVEFWGSDVRIPSIASKGNIYLDRVYKKIPDFVEGREEMSLRRQRMFSKYGVHCIVPGPDIISSIDRACFPNFSKVNSRIILDDFTPVYPSINNQKPLVIHMPSKQLWKGTEYVLDAVSDLKSKYDFDFKLIEGVERSIALKELRKCDIYLDQFVIGGHGLAAVEAMALGKPTICYISDETGKHYPESFPIISADGSILKSKLDLLLQDGIMRNKIGKDSRAYVEKFHDSEVVAKQLLQIYENLLQDK